MKLVNLCDQWTTHRYGIPINVGKNQWIDSGIPINVSLRGNSINEIPINVGKNQEINVEYHKCIYDPSMWKTNKCI